MEKHVRIGMLLDIYGGMLTEAQRNALRMHYDEDMSLREIAENSEQGEASRQAVRDRIVRGEQHLEKLEEKIGALDVRMEMRERLNRLKGLVRQCGVASVSAETDVIVAEWEEKNGFGFSG